MVLLLPAVLAGMSFPLAIRMAVDHPGRAGAGVGRMIAFNTIGGIAGSLATGFVLFSFVGLYGVLRVTTGLSLLIGFASWFLLERPRTPRQRVRLILLSAVLSLVWLVIPSLAGTRLPGDFLAHGYQLVDFREGRSSYMGPSSVGVSRRCSKSTSCPRGPNAPTRLR